MAYNNPEPLPDLPSPPREVAFGRAHILSTHIFPAQYRYSPPSDPQVPDSIQKLKEDQLAYEKHVMSDSGSLVEYITFWCVVNRIARVSEPEQGKRALTVIALHASGHCKETWEPCFRYLIDSTEHPDSPVRIAEIWALDAFHHGDSALLNAGRLPRLVNRAEESNTLLSFLSTRLPLSPSYPPETLPIHLPLLPERTNITPRTVIALGYSMGGDTVASSAATSPRLFSSIVLLEATTYPDPRGPDHIALEKIMTKNTFNRTSSWSSLEDAKKELCARNIRHWHPEAQAAFLTYGLTLDMNGGVRLKTPPRIVNENRLPSTSSPGLIWFVCFLQEAAIYTSHAPSIMTYYRIPSIPESIGMLWLLGERPLQILGGDETALQTAHSRPANSSVVRIPGAGHTMVEEKPEEVAPALYRFFVQKYGDLTISRL